MHICIYTLYTHIESKNNFYMIFIRHNFTDIAETYILEYRIPFKITICSGARKIIISQ